MTIELRVDGNVGKIGIFKHGNQLAFGSPKANARDVYFHTDMPPLTIIEVVSLEVILPERAFVNNDASGTEDYLIGAHTQGQTVAFVPFLAKEMTPPGALIQSSSGTTAALRLASVFLTQTEVYLKETFVAVKDETLPEQTFMVDAVLVEGRADTHPELIYWDASEFRIGTGAVDAAQQYFKQNIAGEFTLTADRTGDIRYGGIIKTPLGNTYGGNGYEGNWPGPTITNKIDT